MTTTTTNGRVEPKVLYRRLDSLIGGLDPNLSEAAIVESCLADGFPELKDGLGLRAALLYSERRDGFELAARAGEGFPSAEMIEASVPPLALVFRHRVYIFASSPEADAPH